MGLRHAGLEEIVSVGDASPRRGRSAALVMSTERMSSHTWGRFDCGLLLLGAWRLGSYPLPASTGWRAGWPRICWRRMLSMMVKLSHKRDPTMRLAASHRLAQRSPKKRKIHGWCGLERVLMVSDDLRYCLMNQSTKRQK